MKQQNSSKGESHSPEREDIDTPQGYKNSPLGIIPDDWEVKKLGEIGTFSKGYGVPKEAIIDNGLSCLTYGDLYTKYDYVIKNIKSFIDNQVAIESKEIAYGDILFAGSGETPEDIGKCAAYIEKSKAYAGGDIIILRPNNHVDSITISYILNSDIGGRQRYRCAQGHSIVHIYPYNLENIEIPLPPLPVQRKIASILTLWDSAIEKQLQLIEKLELRKKGLMQQLLTGKKRLKGFEGEWKEVKLGEIAKVFSGGTPNTSQKEYYVGDIPFIKSGEIFSNRTEQFVSKFGIDNSSAKLVNVGDILYALYGATSGQCAISQIRGAINQAVLCIRTDENSYFISSILKMNKDLYYNSFLQGGQGNLSADIVKKYIFRLPTLTEQTAIATILTAADQEIETEKNKLKQLRQQKKGLMQVLLTGKKRVKI